MKRALLPALLLALLLGGAAIWAASRAPSPGWRREGNLLLLERDGLVYAYNTTFRVEQLFDGGKDPYRTRDLAAARPADVARLRADLLRRLGIGGLEEIPNDSEKWLENMERGTPGYLGRGGERR